MIWRAATLIMLLSACTGFGEPSRDIGSGIHIWIGSADGAEILYVRHEGLASGESTSLYER